MSAMKTKMVLYLKHWHRAAKLQPLLNSLNWPIFHRQTNATTVPIVSGTTNLGYVTDGVRLAVNERKSF